MDREHREPDDVNVPPDGLRGCGHRAIDRPNDPRLLAASLRKELARLRSERRKAIEEAFDELEYTYEEAGGLWGMRRRHRDLTEQYRHDRLILSDLLAKLRDIRDDAEMLGE